MAVLVVWGAAGSMAGAAEDLARVRETWVSSGVEYANTDSLAVCMVNGKPRLYATAKEGHRLDVFDVSNGKWLHSIGVEGATPGQFVRPNGIAAFEVTVGEPARSRPLLIVVERDNARVQAIWADTEKPALVFGEKDLKRPYGVACLPADAGMLLFVTDTGVPPAETVKVYRLTSRGEAIHAERVASFGDAEGPGRIEKAESIAVDARGGRVLICEELEGKRCVKVYDVKGRFLGKHFAGAELVGEPEGIAVADAGTGRVVLVTDQSDELTRWHLYDADSFRHLRSFTGAPVIRNTDGIAVWTGSLPGFPSGALFAVDDDAQVRAYSWGEVCALLTQPSETPAGGASSAAR
jgi:3-phytase